ncbi:MAG: FtsK/SpoIIIE domain-containing protein [Verrucomicrobiota bacterium]
MSKYLDVQASLELLDRLKTVVRDFAAREEKLNLDFRGRTNAQVKLHQEALAQEDVALAVRVSDVEADARAKTDVLKAKYARRESWLGKARKSSLKRALEEIDRTEGGRKYEAQRNLIETSRIRESDLARNETNLAEFQRQLGETRAAYVSIEEIASQAFRGYGKFSDLLTKPATIPEPDMSLTEHQLLMALYELFAKTNEELQRFQKFLFPLLFRYLPLWLLIMLTLVSHAALVPALRHFGIQTVSFQDAGLSALVLVAGLVTAFMYGLRQGRPLAITIAGALEQARRLHNICLEKSAARYQRELARIERVCKERTEQINNEWNAALEEAAAMRHATPRHLEDKAFRLAQTNEHQYQQKLLVVEQELEASLDRLRQQAEARKQQLTESHQAKLAKAGADLQAQWDKVVTEWRAALQPIFAAARAVQEAAAAEFPEWLPALWENWAPPQDFKNNLRFARLEVEVEKLAGTLPKDQRLALPGPDKFSLPLLLEYPLHGSLLLETTDGGSEEVSGALNNIILRLLATTPPGRLSFTIIDPVKLGQNFAGVMHLADYEEHLINSRIWTQASQIEEQLAFLNEHMEKVIQMYLRSEYPTIVEYNEQAGNIAEKYHFLVIADFPMNFSETAIRRLLHIAASGARCGVFTLVHWDHRHLLPQDLVPKELRRNSIAITSTGQDLMLSGQFIQGARLVLDAPPDPDFATEFMHRAGKASKGSNRVEVPFAHVAPPTEAEVWSGDTTSELRVPIGRTGATKLQYLAIGKGTRQHALIAGKTGSGKSTLFHVMITNLAMWCSPEQVEFYLVDFKKGVEFKCYATARLPHARVVAIESDREFGLSVLQRVDDELKRRGDMFRKLGVQDIAGYKRMGGTEPIPRSLLLIDEFQEFFVEDDRVSQDAAVLMDRIVRQGRAFGIHVILGSQTLGGAYTLARTTMGQMVIRIALQCNEADAYLIMDDTNPAPRLLSRPGEGIYNDTAGTVEGNSPFQTVWLPDEVRQGYLETARRLADQKGLPYPGPLVFEGNAPSDIRENQLLRTLLASGKRTAPSAPRIWLGAPNSIKGPTEVVFQRQSGNHLIMVGQRDEAVLAIVSLALVALAAQYPVGGVKLILVDSTQPETPQREHLDRIIRAIPHGVTVAKNNDLPAVMEGLTNDLKSRADETQSAPGIPTFLIIHGLQNFKKLRQEDEYSFSSGGDGSANPAAQLTALLNEGASLGLHVIATCDTYNNANRFLGRKAMGEFEMRVLFQMSANDSASLIDNPKASTLGLHRALFYNEQEGYLELFRPYALPTREWIEQAGNHLAG